MYEGPEVWRGIRQGSFGSDVCCLIACNFADIIERKWTLLMALNLFKMNNPLLDWPLLDRLVQKKHNVKVGMVRIVVDTPTLQGGLGQCQ